MTEQHGSATVEAELFDLICEARSMSDYASYTHPDKTLVEEFAKRLSRVVAFPNYSEDANPLERIAFLERHCADLANQLRAAHVAPPEQHGSTTDRIAELEREIAEKVYRRSTLVESSPNGLSRDDLASVSAINGRLETLRAELSRLREEEGDS